MGVRSSFTNAGRRRRTLAGALVLTTLAAAGGCGEESSPPETTTTETGPVAGSESEFVVGVDRRVELLSVLFHLAGSPPYGAAAGPYALAANEHFAPFSDHPAVVATQALTAKHGISYDAPVELAAYLDASLHPIRPLSPLPPGLDPRWEGTDIDRYLGLVRRFADDSDFDRFYKSQSGYHATVEDAFDQFLAGTTVIGWFDELFGRRPMTTYRVVPGLLTGGFSFGTTAVAKDGAEDVAQVMFLEASDQEGVPHPTSLSLEFLAHEVAHSYVNPIFEPRAESMRSSALPLFERVEEAMRRQAYTTYPIMVNESVVRAITVLFLRDSVSEQEAERSLGEQLELSFLWTPELVDALDALRSENGGRLEPEALVSATQRVFADWLEQNG